MSLIEIMYGLHNILSSMHTHNHSYRLKNVVNDVDTNMSNVLLKMAFVWQRRENIREKKRRFNSHVRERESERKRGEREREFEWWREEETFFSPSSSDRGTQNNFSWKIVFFSPRRTPTPTVKGCYWWPLHVRVDKYNNKKTTDPETTVTEEEKKADD